MLGGTKKESPRPTWGGDSGGGRSSGGGEVVISGCGNCIRDVFGVSGVGHGYNGSSGRHGICHGRTDIVRVNLFLIGVK